MAIYTEDYCRSLLENGDFIIPLNGYIDNVTMNDPDGIYSIRLKNYDNAKIIVHSNDNGNIAHFHITRSNGKDACIMIEENKYFEHGQHKGKLTTKESREFNRFLLFPFRANPNITIWRAMLYAWNEGNDRAKSVSIDTIQPDYSIIMPYK